MWIARSLFVSIIAALIFGVISTALNSSFIEYKNPEEASKVDLTSMTYAQGEQWHKENAITKDGFSAVKLTFSDWFLFKYWLLEQWLIFVVCFICCLVTHKLSNKYVS